MLWQRSVIGKYQWWYAGMRNNLRNPSKAVLDKKGMSYIWNSWKCWGLVNVKPRFGNTIHVFLHLIPSSLTQYYALKHGLDSALCFPGKTALLLVWFVINLASLGFTLIHHLITDFIFGLSTELQVVYPVLNNTFQKKQSKTKQKTNTEVIMKMESNQFTWYLCMRNTHQQTIWDSILKNIANAQMFVTHTFGWNTRKHISLCRLV